MKAHQSSLNLPLPSEVKALLQTFHQQGYELYIVGGAIRDALLGIPVTDWDFATSADPTQIQQLFPETSYYNNTYGTVTIQWPMESGSEIHFEVTPFRQETGYSDARHPDAVIWGKTIEEDLARRDFTINALAYDGQKIIDLYGGRDDLTARIIRAVGDADARFAEDGLRLMRAVRFAAELGFLIDPTTKEAMVKNAECLQRIAWERITQELLRILVSPHPAEGVLFLKNTHLLKYILPEVDVCFGVPQKSPKRHHIYDVGTHLIMSLKACPSTDAITRLATLIHDIGKARTYHKDPQTQIITFYNHEVVGAQMAERIAERLRLSSVQSDKLVRLVAHHQFVVSEDLTDNAIRRFIRNVTKEYLPDMFALRQGDRIGGAATETSWRTELFKKRVAELLIEPFTVKDLKIDGNDVMNVVKIKPSRRVGDILDTLFQEVIDKKIPNERAPLLEALSKISA